MRRQPLPILRGWNPALLLGLVGLVAASALDMLLDRREGALREYATHGLQEEAREAGMQWVASDLVPVLERSPSYGPMIERVVTLCQSAGIDSFRYTASTVDRTPIDAGAVRWARQKSLAAEADRDTGVVGGHRAPAATTPWAGWHEVRLTAWSSYRPLRGFLDRVRVADPPFSILDVSIDGEEPDLRMEVTLRCAAQDY